MCLYMHVYMFMRASIGREYAPSCSIVIRAGVQGKSFSCGSSRVSQMFACGQFAYNNAHYFILFSIGFDITSDM